MNLEDRQLLQALAANAAGGQEWNRPMISGRGMALAIAPG